MRILATMIAFAFLAFSTQACSQYQSSDGNRSGKTVKASKNYVTKDIRVENFTGLSVAGSPNVIYTQKAGSPKVEVYTSDNVVDLLDIRVKDGTLTIGFKKGVSVSYNKLDIRVSSESLNRISIAGSGDVALANGLKTDDLSLRVAGSGDADVKDIDCKSLDISIAGSGDIEGKNVRCTSLKMAVAGSGDMKLSNVESTDTEASVSGSGNITLSGKTQEANYQVSGSGDLWAAEFEAKRASASVSGSGKIKCHATDFLKARTSGSGSIGYKGNPELDTSKKGVHRL